MEEDSSKIILFDGICNFCIGAVNFIIRRDPKAKFRFASLQSEYAHQLSGRINITPDFVIYIRDEKVFEKSTAALLILRDIGGFWKLFYSFIVIPKIVRDYFYDLIAEKRYNIFGRREQCLKPSPDIRKRFLE